MTFKKDRYPMRLRAQSVIETFGYSGRLHLLSAHLKYEKLTVQGTQVNTVISRYLKVIVDARSWKLLFPTTRMLFLCVV